MTKKTFTLADMRSASGSGTNKRTLALIRQLGIKPVQEMKTATRTYRIYDKAAVDAMSAHRAKKAQASATVTMDPTPVVEPAKGADTMLRDAVAQLNKDLLAAFQYLNTSQTSIHARLDRVNDTLTQMLDAATAPKSDVLTRAINGAKDDAPEAH